MISIINKRWPWDCLIFLMGILSLVRRHLYIKTGQMSSLTWWSITHKIMIPTNDKKTVIHKHLCLFWCGTGNSLCKMIQMVQSTALVSLLKRLPGTCLIFLCIIDKDSIHPETSNYIILQTTYVVWSTAILQKSLLKSEINNKTRCLNFRLHQGHPGSLGSNEYIMVSWHLWLSITLLCTIS